MNKYQLDLLTLVEILIIMLQPYYLIRYEIIF
jgi:hypothetical protein